MSFISDILEKVGLKKPAAAVAPKAGPVPSVNVGNRGTVPMSTPQAAPVAMPMVDVVAKLDGLAKKNPQKLDWKVSIVDLLKLLEIDSSLQARKTLAMELGCPAQLMNESATMNVWLHKTVMQKIAANGGNIPKELL
jgi:hypothetical protein